jgi:two-component system sensor histidine kinase UhpB
VQEQLNNIVKHSKATTVIIGIKQNCEALQLQIKDDGIGFDSFEKRKGIGLKNIVSRAASLDGELVIHTNPGEGCELLINFNIPLGGQS